jgi:hypothetical protein
MGAAREGKFLLFDSLGIETRETPPEGDSSRRIRPRVFARVPTHVIGVAQERRLYPRANLRLPLRVKRVAGQVQSNGRPLVTQDISPSGVYFFFPEGLEPGTPLEIEIGLVSRPVGRGSVRMDTEAHVVRAEQVGRDGWHGVAVAFDDITFHRDEQPPENKAATDKAAR